MAEMDIEQVIQTLQRKFKENQKFIFWYDDDGAFQGSLADIEEALAGTATVVELLPGHQLSTKLRLINAAETEKILIYAPQAQPPIAEDHLRDLTLCSMIFKADAQEILRRELGLPENLHKFVKDHKLFFASKARRSRFERYELTSYQNRPTLAIMATIVKLQQPLVDFFAILRIILKEGIDENKYLIEFEKYDVLEDFWTQISVQFDYRDEEQPTLLDLSAGLYVTMAFEQMNLKVPQSSLQYDLSHKSANIETFMQQFGASVYIDKVDRFAGIANELWRKFNFKKIFDGLEIDAIVRSDVFPQFDMRILQWIQAQLLLKNDQIEADGLTVDTLTKKRRATHYGRTDQLKHQYLMIRSAWQLIRQENIQPADNMQELITNYVDRGYYLDMDYRHFIYEYQQLIISESYRELRALIESLYVTQLSKFATNWNQSLSFEDLKDKQLQQNFYEQYIQAQTNRIVVIVSDSLRFEVGKELQSSLSSENQVTDTEMHYLITGLPSVTYLGMPALLPHRKLTLQADAQQVLVDDQEANNLEKRQKILQKRNPKSVACRYKDLQNMTRDEFRAFFANQEVVYIYHNKIDTTAENRETEDEAFRAAAETITELKQLIERLRTNSIRHVYLTADHGYLYRNDKLPEINKVVLDADQFVRKAPRYTISDQKIETLGVRSQKLGTILQNDDPRYVNYPSTANVFKASGGDNYVHGGSSLEEMVVPLLEIQTTSNKSTAKMVRLQLTSTNRRITSLEVPVSVMQTEAVSADVLPAAFKLYFVNKMGQQISGQVVVNANKKSKAVGDRIYNVPITLIDQHYNRDEKYDLIIENLTDRTQQKLDYLMDIVNSEDL